MLRQSLRMTWRDWRAGELHFLVIALVVAVAALAAVGFFVDRMRAGLVRDASQLLGADLVLSADHPLDGSWRGEAERRGLSVARTVVFPSMATAGQGDALRAQLAALKAVSPGYPLRGVLKLAGPNGKEVSTRKTPDAGTVWVDPALLTALGAQVGDTLRLGDAAFRIARVIAIEPDRGNAFVNFAPRVMFPLSDLDATGLIQPGSRATYRLLVNGSPPTIAAFREWAEARIERDAVRGMRIESLDSGRPEMRATLDRAQRFLSLVGLLAAMLAAVAIAMAARRFVLRHLDACAMLRCLGLTQRRMTALFLAEFALIGLVGSGIGVAVGYAAHFGLLRLLAGFVATDLPPAGPVPAAQGLLTGMILLLGFALPPLLQLRDVPLTRVIRRESSPPKPVALATYGIGLIAFGALLLWQAGDARLAAYTAGGFLGCAAVFAAVARAGLVLLKTVRETLPSSAWRFAVTALQRRPGATVLQAVALALGLMALLLLTVVRGDLIGAWRAATPEDAPNRFVINIQPDQKADVAAMLKQGGVADAPLYPMIRGRLVAVNGAPVAADTYRDDRARRLVNREFNLSTMRDPPAQNRIVAGRWFDDSTPEASVEQGLAETLGLKLGDRLRFDVAGEKVDATVTSLRKLDWGSLQVNFFVILNPSAVADLPQSWITAFRLPPEKATLVNRLTAAFPNLTVLDVGAIVRQIQSVLDQVIAAVEFLFLFALASGLLVLYAALAGSQDQRMREAALLRALGATRRELQRSQRIEFLLVGGIAGLLAANGAAAVGWALARQVFNFDWTFSPVLWVAGALLGAACALAGGWLGLRNVLERTPMTTLRET